MGAAFVLSLGLAGAGAASAVEVNPQRSLRSFVEVNPQRVEVNPQRVEVNPQYVEVNPQRGVTLAVEVNPQ
ncbi:hypothetical protein [Brachybacterium sp. YJGR34]|uniref:hypothetical protein n=1 Tax=Brachybacterium sp. YJGR34 TaxID=2059911 RepID=UPI001300223A|nr:hypothetical protein [Brachybacterium sp. YJGR34]